jgi:hypothetical protein
VFSEVFDLKPTSGLYLNGEDCLPIATVAFAPLAPLQHLQPGEPGVFP